MSVSKREFLIVIALWIALSAQAAFAQQNFKIEMQLSKSAILLGEPVWVLVTARNVSKAPLKFNPGDYCNIDRPVQDPEMPVVAVVPDAAPGNGKLERCQYGSPGGDCFMGGSTTTLAPEQSATWRYLLEGNFHFTHAGTYRAELTSHPALPFRGDEDRAPADAKLAPVSQTVTLEVLPKDDAALLAIEKQMAADVDTQITQMRWPTPQEDRDAKLREMQNLEQIRKGIAAQPALGMEAVFERWLNNNWGIVGLRNLNSKESREALAKIAEEPVKPNSYIEAAATSALGEMGDGSYFPLMVHLMVSPNEGVRRAAIRGMGSLGGDAAVPVLLEEMRTAPDIEHNDAMSALGNTKSRAAVKALIDLTDGRGSDYQSTWWPLFVLTHHSLPKVTYLRTAEQTHEEWQRWWDAGGKNAPVYSPYECAPKGAL